MFGSASKWRKDIRVYQRQRTDKGNIVDTKRVCLQRREEDLHVKKRKV